jgi:putative MFS transporter
MAIGRIKEAHVVLRNFGCTVRAGAAAVVDRSVAMAASPLELGPRTWALSIAAFAWGLINFGLLLWMPMHLVAKGYSMALSSSLLAASALIAVPTVFAAAWIYSAWSSRGALAASIALTGAGLIGLIHLEWASPADASPVLPIALLIIGINGLIAMLLPYAAESYPLRIRARATGWVAACTKAGGLAAQFLSLFGLVPALGWAALLVLAPVLLGFMLVLRHGPETRGTDLRQLEEPA